MMTDNQIRQKVTNCSIVVEREEPEGERSPATVPTDGEGGE